MPKRTVSWLSPLKDECQVCGFSFEGVMYDANLGSRWGGSWGNVCKSCFKECGCYLGLGHGQEYHWKKNEGVMRWVKVAG